MLDTFCSIWNLKNSRKEPTCFKNTNNPSCIVLFSTSTIRSFQETQVFEKGLSDVHKLVVTVLKSTFPKLPPNVITYRSYKNFSNDLLRNDFNYLPRQDNMTLEFASLTSFTKIFLKTLDKHAPIEEKHICGNHANFANKKLTESNNAKI